MKGVEKNDVEKKERIDYVANVLNARDFSEDSKLDTNVAFDMEVNGIKIYGCWLKEGTSKDGKDYSLVSLPSAKGKDGKYYSLTWFPISKELTSNIKYQISKMV